jgi:hypothetical protein
VSSDNEVEYVEPVERLLRFEFPLGSQLKWIRDHRRAARAARDYSLSVLYRRGDRRPLIRDPFATFMTPWLHERFGAQIVLMVRHPLGFISSLKTHGFQFDFSHWASQPLLLKDVGEERAEEIEMAARSAPDVVDQGILLWKVIYRTIARYAARFPGWQVVHYEDLALHPLEEFKRIYARLELPWTPRVERAVQRYSTAKRSSTSPYSIARNGREMPDVWKARLSPSEIERIEKGLRGATEIFYPDPSWEMEGRSVSP